MDHFWSRLGIYGTSFDSWIPVCGPYSSQSTNIGFKRLADYFRYAILLTPATSIGLIFGAESALQNYEHGQRSHDNLIRARAMRELGMRGIIASEQEIKKWQEEVIEREIELRRSQKP